MIIIKIILTIFCISLLLFGISALLVFLMWPCIMLDDEDNSTFFDFVIKVMIVSASTCIISFVLLASIAIIADIFKN